MNTKLNKKLRIVFILIFSIISISNGYCQDLPQTVAYGQRLIRTKNYQEAILTFQRVLFFDKSNTFHDRVYQDIASCYYQLEDFKNAAEYYDLAYFSATSDSAKTKIQLKKISSLLLDKNYQYALIDLLNLPDSLSGHLEQQQNFYFAVAYYKLKKFDEAKKYFLQAVETQNSNSQEKIRMIFRNVYKTEKINANTAKILSILLPGSGQIYAGDIKNGGNSILLLSAIAYLAYQTSLSYSIVDALVSTLPWYQKYYTGGYNMAERIALERQARKFQASYNELLEIIAENRLN